MIAAYSWHVPMGNELHACEEHELELIAEHDLWYVTTPESAWWTASEIHPCEQEASQTPCRWCEEGL